MTKNGEVVIKTWVLKVYIHCEGCKKKVKKVLQSIEGVLTTTIDAPEQKVTVTGNVPSADILVKKLLKANKHAEEWPQPQNIAQKDKVEEKDKSPPPPKQKEKDKEKKDKDKEKKAAKDEDGEEGAKKGVGKNAGGSGEGAKKVEDAEESGGAAPSEGKKGGGGGGGGASAESSSSGGGKKKKGGKGGGGGGEATPVEPSPEAVEFSGYSPVASGGGGFGPMSGGGYNGGFGHMNSAEAWMSHAQGMGGPSYRPIAHYAQYAPHNAPLYTHQSYATVQNAAYQFNDENAAYAFNDENTGSCSVM